MLRFPSLKIIALSLVLAPIYFADAQTPAYKYFRLGIPTISHSTFHSGFALMGGGKDLDEAFRWLCDHGGGGDFLVLRATGDDDYDPYIKKLCPLNSAATLIIPNRAAANDPFVAKTISEASVLFIAGGDQANYINFWTGTPVQMALDDAIHRGVPIGGTSAGLAVLGEYAYTAQGDKPDDADLSAKLAMSNPFGPRVTLERGFLDIPALKRIITDTHFVKRDRMGRLLVFLARLNEPDGKPVAPAATPTRGIGVEQGAAVLVEPDGSAKVIGYGSAYFIDAGDASGVMIGGKFTVMALDKPLTFGPYDIQKVASGRDFNLRTWTGDATHYALSIKAGAIQSTQAGGAVY
jgi:cyanophycinase